MFIVYAGDFLNNNPIIPGYTADASIFYDELHKRFYIFGTNDGNYFDNVWPPQVWYSDDFVNWERKDVILPEGWFPSDHNKIWAPSIMKHPKTGLYYIVYSIHSSTYIAMANSPLGPWKDACGYGSNQPLLASGKVWGAGGDAYDAQFFVDDDAVYLTFGGWEQCGIARLSFDKSGRVTIFDDPRMMNKSICYPYFKYNKLTGLHQYYEASSMFKRNGLYYLLWSAEGCENYKVYYAVSDNPISGFRSVQTPILEGCREKNILGTGHQSVFKFNGEYYISYHRQHYPFVDSKRQTCAEKLKFAPDGSIYKITPSNTGINPLNATEKTNIAFNKPVIASSQRGYIPNNICSENYIYSAQNAVDGSFSTRWESETGDKSPWIIIDLEEHTEISEISLIFEYVSRRYCYKIEHKTGFGERLDNIDPMNGWTVIADRTKTGQISPSKHKCKIKTRFIKITLTGADSPKASAPSDPNAVNGLGLVSISII